MDVSERIPRTWMPAIHAGMTVMSISCFVGERRIMDHFVVTRINGIRHFDAHGVGI